MKTVNTLQINEDALLKGIQEYFVDVANDLADSLLDNLSREIMENGVARMKWREEAVTELRKMTPQIVADYISVDAGIDFSGMEKHLRNRIIVVLFGNQANGPLFTKPGFDVYGKEMDGQHTSTATSARWLPDGWNMTADGDKMVENAIKLTDKYVSGAMERAWRNIPDELFYGNVSVIGGD